jgi:hypothetical protein
MVGLQQRQQLDGAPRFIWNGWQGRTWLCWASTGTALEVPAVAAVRDAVLQA